MKRFVDLLKEDPILMRMMCPEAFNGKSPKRSLSNGRIMTKNCKKISGQKRTKACENRGRPRLKYIL